MTVRSRPLAGFALIALACCGASAQAAAAHVHGEGELDLAVENGRVDLFLRAPLGDLASDGGRDAPALDARYRETPPFSLTGAPCTLVEHTAEVTAAGGSDPLDAFADAHAGAGHDDHGMGGDDHEDAHAEDDHGGHSDGVLSWAYECSADPTAFSAAALFEGAAIGRLRVQAIGPAGVTSFTLTPANPELELR